MIRNEKTALLEYVVTGEKIYLFVLTKNPNHDDIDLRLHSINIGVENLTERVRGFREMLADRSPVFADAARELYNTLIRPAESQILGKDSLCIIPDGALWDLPFQVLQPTSDRYLVEDHALYYAPSLAVLKEMLARQKAFEHTPASLLAFGNPSLGNESANTLKAVYRGTLAPLPEAETEVNALKKIWGYRKQ